MDKRILIIGTGNIGKRYLQAIYRSGLNNIPCYCYDIIESSLKGVEDFLHSHGFKDTTNKLYEYQDFLDLISDESLVIVATTAKDRIDLLLDILNHNPRYLIIEKPVTQTKAEYDILLKKYKSVSTKAYVHYYLRFQPYIKKLKALFEGASPIFYSVTLPGNGIACNGIHFIDLFLWLVASNKTVVSSSKTSSIYEQKRSGFWDVYGGLCIETGASDYGSVVNSKIVHDHIMNVGSGSKLVTIYEDQSVAININTIGKHSLTKIDTRFASDYLVDVMRGYTIDNWQDGLELTCLEDAFLSHQVLFKFLQLSGYPNLNIT